MNIHQLNQRLARKKPYFGTTYSTDLYYIPRIVCKDRVTLSVQASRAHYSYPASNIGPYSAVEIGYPSMHPGEAIMEYCEDCDDPTGTVYAYVPIGLVVDFINEHGGSRLSY